MATNVMGNRQGNLMRREKYGPLGHAIGHPFGATGARVVMQLLYELGRRGLNLGLLTVCAAGGVGLAMVVERE